MEFFHPNLLTLFFWLLVGHYLADFPLQGPFMSEAKNRHTAPGKLFWPHALFGHGVIHGGFVLLFTGSLLLATMEVLFHVLTDWLKCENRISVRMDQAIHLNCKASWAILTMLTIGGPL